MSSNKAMMVLSAAAAVRLAKELLPVSLKGKLLHLLSGLLRRPRLNTIVIAEVHGLAANPMYNAVEMYLAMKLPPTTRRFCVSIRHDSDALNFIPYPAEPFPDAFCGATFTWRLLSRTTDRTSLWHGDLYSRSSCTMEPTSTSCRFVPDGVRDEVRFVLHQSGIQLPTTEGHAPTEI